MDENTTRLFSVTEIKCTRSFLCLMCVSVCSWKIVFAAVVLRSGCFASHGCSVWVQTTKMVLGFTVCTRVWMFFSPSDLCGCDWSRLCENRDADSLCFWCQIRSVVTMLHEPDRWIWKSFTKTRGVSLPVASEHLLSYSPVLLPARHTDRSLTLSLHLLTFLHIFRSWNHQNNWDASFLWQHVPECDH